MKTPLPEIESSEPKIPERKSRPWDAFAYRDFRLLWFGMLISQLGQWMQFTSLTYLVGVLLATSAAHGALYLGLLGAARSIPVLLFAPLAGVVADRYPRRLTLLLTNLARAGLALALAYISRGHGPYVLLLALIMTALFAAVNSFDAPARHSWVSFLVPRPLISNAIGLVSIARNIPLMIGPAIAGILISAVGVYASFLVQAVTQWAVVAAIVLMKPSPRSEAPRQRMLGEMATGMRFVVSHDVLRWVALSLLITCIFVRPYNLLLAAFAGQVLHVDAKAYGIMLAAGGIGTLSGALTTAIHQSERRGRVWFVSGSAAALALILLAHAHNFILVLVLLATLGWASMSFITSTNVLFQILSPEDMRGRTISFYTLITSGFIPAGVLLLGSLGSVFGLPTVYVLGGSVGLAFGIWIWAAHPAVRHA
jgi:MFS family permease